MKKARNSLHFPHALPAPVAAITASGVVAPFRTASLIAPYVTLWQAQAIFLSFTALPPRLAAGSAQALLYPSPFPQKTE